MSTSNPLERIESQESDGQKSIVDRIQQGDSWQQSDLALGQPVIIAVRWVLIVSALVLALWNVTDMGELRLQIVVILVLALTNFYLQAQLLMKRKVNSAIVYAASAVDLAVVSTLVLYQGGYDSSIYIFYLPAIAAFAVAFPRGLTAIYTVATILLYGLICLGTENYEANILLTRVLMITAVAVCGAVYLHLEHERRTQSLVEEAELLNSLGVVGAE